MSMTLHSPQNNTAVGLAHAFKPHPSQLNLILPDKKFYSQHGILVFGTNDKGEERISLKLSSLPIDADFNGWFSVFPPKDKPNGNAPSNNADPEF